MTNSASKSKQIAEGYSAKAVFLAQMILLQASIRAHIVIIDFIPLQLKVRCYL